PSTSSPLSLHDALPICEVLGAQWSEIDSGAKLWTVPAGRMKGGREHRIPLASPAMAVLKRMAKARENDHVFPGDRRAMLSNMARSEEHTSELQSPDHLV